MADDPVYGQQALTWAWTLLDLAEVARDRLIVWCLETSPSSVRRQLEEIGVETVTVSPFDRAFPHCNKLVQLDADRFGGRGVTVFSDTDIAFAGNIDDLPSPTAIRAKIVDLPNPPLHMWHRILGEAGVAEPPSLTSTSFGEHTTPSVNCNGGLYMLPGWAIDRLTESWPRWVRWLIARPALLPDGFNVHTDQVGFGLALLEHGLAVNHLPLAANFPTHGPAASADVPPPRVLHYHRRVDPSGFLLPTGAEAVDQAIARVNHVIAARRRDGFDNRSFWDFRYKQAPEVGSGLGSRGPALEQKRRLASTVALPTDSVLDVGCGDLEVTKHLHVGRYVGVDISDEAVALARAKRPDWSFHCGTVHDLPPGQFDLVLSFDVLIHQPTEADYRSLVFGLARRARRHLVVGGYNQPPWHQSEITFYYESLRRSLARLVGVECVEIVGGYRDVSVVSVNLAAMAGRETLLDRLGHAERVDSAHGSWLAFARPGAPSTEADVTGMDPACLDAALALVSPDDFVLDIGAHAGGFAALAAARVGPAGRVVAIDAEAANLELIFHNLAAHRSGQRVDVTDDLVAAERADFAAILPSADTTTRFVVDRHHGARSSTAVDDIVERESATDRRLLLKVTVGSMTMSVLDSALSTLARSRPTIVGAVSPGDQVAPTDLVAFFGRVGYDLTSWEAGRWVSTGTALATERPSWTWLARPQG